MVATAHNNASSIIYIRRSHALGDALMATTVADKLHENGVPVCFQSHSNAHCILRRVPSIQYVWELGVPIPSPQVNLIDLDGVYERNPNRRSLHFHAMFFDAANAKLRLRNLAIGPAVNCRPRMIVKPEERAWATAQFEQYPRPWVFICPRSNSWNHRQVPDDIWQSAAAKIKGTKFWLGTHDAPPGIVDLKARHFDNVILWLSVADLLVTVDTGPMHVAAALGVPVVAMGQSSSPARHLNDQNDWVEVAPPLNCLNCQKERCPINPDEPPCRRIDPGQIAEMANARLDSVFGDKVSAVIPIWKPDVNVLNRCLAAITPQVSEVIVCAEAMSVVPNRMMTDLKIRLVRTDKANVGIPGNINHGIRHSNGAFVWCLNDDAFLEPDCVANVMREMKPGVGAISHLLRYPDGKIYHAGKIRTPGHRGWSHIDHLQTNPTIKDVVSQENTCGCSILFRRKALFDSGCWDEELRFFTNDDALCLSIRKAGYEILYTPHASAVHMEHQSVNKIGKVYNLCKQDEQIFGRKFKKYLDHNLNRVPGDFNY